MPKVVFCTPTLQRPHAPFFAALEESIPVLNDLGWLTESVYEIGNPYISAARATMTRKALDVNPDVIVYLDHDISWGKHDLLKLLEAKGEVVAGTYRFKTEVEEYMGSVMSNEQGTPLVEGDLIRANAVPAGFLKITPDAINRFMTAYPQLCYGPKYHLAVDLFNHGAHKGLWYGEDYAFSRNWVDMGEKLWIIPDVEINHHSENTVFRGNFHNFLRRQPGGDLAVKAA